MLDQFHILSVTGVGLWSRSFSAVPDRLAKDFISDVFIEQNSTKISANGNSETLNPSPSYTWNAHAVRWATAKELGLIFMAVYHSRLNIAWIDQLLKTVRTLFTEKFKDQLTPARLASTTVFDCPFDRVFDIQLSRLESAAIPSFDPVPRFEPLSRPDTPLSLSSAPDSEANDHSDAGQRSTQAGQPPNNPLLLTGPAGRQSRRARKAAAQHSQVSKARPVPTTKKGKPTKQMRKWDADGMTENDDPDMVLDYSSTKPADGLPVHLTDDNTAASDSWGTRTTEGEFLVKDLEEIDSILASAKSREAESAAADAAPKGAIQSGLSAIGGLFRNVVGGKTLTKAELSQALTKMEHQLVAKNVAREAAVQLCKSVEEELIGLKTASFTSVDSTLKVAMERALRKMLTPTNSLDLLREVVGVVDPSSSSSARPATSEPYVISIVGVNGVGKSTNLSKLAYFFLQNGFRVLVVAADTFRSGAVEQLGVHVRNLKELVRLNISSSSSPTSSKAGIELYQRGYGTNAGKLANEAVNHARENGWQVVLIDTAGRRHNDTRLMSDLGPFAAAAKPHKIFMVGEALVGNDSVQQAQNFNDALGRVPGSARSGATPGRRLDGFIISKCDTVGDMVGTLVSMVHATGIPVVFLGVGQHYPDLRTLSVPWAVNMLMA